VDVRVISSGEPGGLYAHLVLATPTFILNGRKMSLGNPSPAQLDEAILSALKGPRR
jgi:protein-disulfide isomerase